MRNIVKALGARWTKKISDEGKSFAKSEDGTMLAFGLIIFVIMMMAGGLAVDFMRYEHDRARMQYAVDRALLAAGSLNQPLDPEAVVIDYLSKADLGNIDLSVDPSVNPDLKVVTASVKSEMNTYFANMLGIQKMDVNASGTAIEGQQMVEISLVLDVSGSMGSNQKLENLKIAAKDFVDTVLTDANRDFVSISIVPYNMQVNAGANILNQMLVTDEHAYSNCIDFADDQFGSTALNVAGTTYQRTGHFDPFYRNSTDHPNTNYDDDFTRVFMCPTTQFSEISLFSQDNDALKAKIDSFQAGGNTSIDIGVRWGAAFLDPSTQPIVQNASGVSPEFTNRPLPYDPGKVEKILVVMTDGVNTTQYQLDQNYASGPSNIWMDPDSTWLSIMNDPGTGPDTNGDGINDDAEFFNSDLYLFDLDGDGVEDKETSTLPYNPDRAVRLDWPDVWNLMSVKYNAYYHYYAQDWNSSDYYQWRDQVMDSVNQAEKNARLDTACTAAKSQGISVYTIGFEVTTDSALVMEKCASSPSNYFGVEGDEISDAFGAIAGMVQRLRLVN